MKMTSNIKTIRHVYYYDVYIYIYTHTHHTNLGGNTNKIHKTKINIY